MVTETVPRADPYRGGLPAADAIVWTGRADVELRMRAQQGVVPLRTWLQVDGDRKPVVTREEAVRRLLAHNRPMRLTILAAIYSWRTVTAEQLAALVGSRHVLDSRTLDLRLLWLAGLVDHGRAKDFDGHAYGPVMWRPARGYDHELLLEWLTYPEWLQVTGGRAWSVGHAVDTRHNVLNTEASLCVAEQTSLSAVIGETAGEHLWVVDEGVRPTSLASADAMWLRDDGLRCAIEMTASRSKSISGKIQKWSGVLMNDKSRSTMVVFLEAARPGAESNAAWRRMQRDLQDARSKGGRGWRDNGLDDRIALARWADLWPSEAPSTVTPTSLQLTVLPVQPNGEWRGVNLLDPFDVPGPEWHDDQAARRMMAAASSLPGVPVWQRRSVPNFGSLLRERAGWPVQLGA